MTAPSRPSADRSAEPRGDALVLRLAGGLALLAAAIFLTCLTAITRLPTATVDGVPAGYAIPGTAHVLDAAILPVLAWCGGIAALLGCAAMLLGRLAPGRIVTMPDRSRRRTSRRPLVILAAGAAALLAVLLLRR